MLFDEVKRRAIESDDPLERLSLEQREISLAGRLQHMVRYAYREAPAVRGKMDKAKVSPNDIRTIKDLEKIPITTKDELVKLQRANPPFGGFTSVPLSSLARIYVSPGPLYVPWSQKRSLVGARDHYRFLGARPGDKVMVTTSFHMLPGGNEAARMLDMIGCTVIPTGVGQTDLQIQIMRELGVNGHIGFPTFLMTMIKRAEELGYDFRKDFNLRWAWCGGERHGSLLRKSLEEDYGLFVWQGYGAGDVGWIAHECEKHNGMHIHEELLFVEICDPQTGKQVALGEVGEVVVTSFDEVYPLIRFGTGDLASFSTELCPCGRTTPRIAEIKGMVGAHLRIKSIFVHRREVEEAVSKMPVVSKAQVVVTLAGHKDVLTVRVELAKEDIDRQAFSELFTKTCHEVFRLNPDKIEFLPKGTLGSEYEVLVDQRWGPSNSQPTVGPGEK